MSGASDDLLFQICRKESRCLVTLDFDFSNILRYPPAESAGLAVFRLPKQAKLTDMEDLVRQFLVSLGTNKLEQQLWIIEPGRIRIHQGFDQ